MNLNSVGEVSILQEIKKFLEDNVTSKVWFQSYPDDFVIDLYTDIDPNLRGYDWTYDIEIEHPIVKLMSYESVKNNRDYYAPTTQIVVQMLNSRTSQTEVGGQYETEMQIRLELISCNSGTHANEVYYRQEKTEVGSLPFGTLAEFETKAAAEFFADGDGWVDVLHLATMIKQALESCPGGRIAGNIRYNPQDGFTITPKGNGEEIYEMYPFYVADLEFSVISYTTNRTNEDLYDGL